MLDLRAIVVTPGAGPGTLGLTTPAVAAGDGCPLPGIPLDPAATLALYAYLSITADTIGRIKLSSHDMVDEQNGEDITLGAASLLVEFHRYINLKYKTGARFMQLATNTGVVAGTGLLLDDYPNQGTMETYGNDRSRFETNVLVPGTLTFGGALTTNIWGTLAFTPANPIPNGKYAILGAYVTAIANAAAIRFAHTRFAGMKPGFPVVNTELALATTVQVTYRDRLMLEQGYQFVVLSELTGKPQCPVFQVTNAGTGLTIEMISAQGDTPVVTLNLVRLGD
jgi:hypothetical protein